MHNYAYFNMYEVNSCQPPSNEEQNIYTFSLDNVRSRGLGGKMLYQIPFICTRYLENLRNTLFNFPCFN